MRIRKWLMKQQWRIVQIRGIWGLFYGILLLAIAYYEYIPFFTEMVLENIQVGPFIIAHLEIGPFVFALIILISFVILGYIYDKVLILWAPSQEVIQERNPYQYVPSPKDHIYWLPLYSALLDATEELAEKFDIDTDVIQNTKRHFSKLVKLRPERTGDIEKGAEIRREYISKYKFSDLLDTEKKD